MKPGLPCACGRALFPTPPGQGNAPAVSMADVERVVAAWRAFPLRTVSGRERARLANLERDLKHLVFGQGEAH